MADSAQMFLPKGVWVEVVEGPLTDCLVTPSRNCFGLYSAATPVDTTGRPPDFGHAVSEFENYNAVPEASQSFWMMSPNGDAEIWFTERPEA